MSLLRDSLPAISNYTLSFKPNLHSGIPLNADFILTAPIISDLKTSPLLDTKILSFSTTSKNISFF